MLLWTARAFILTYMLVCLGGVWLAYDEFRCAVTRRGRVTFFFAGVIMLALLFLPFV